MKRYSQNELKLGVNDEQIADSYSGETSLRIGSDGGVYTKPFGLPEVPVGGGAAAVLGLDELSNVLVVDGGFDASTPGWGVTSFADVASAIPLSAGKTIHCFGTIEETAAISFSGSVIIFLHKGSVIDCNLASLFDLSGGAALYISGFGELRSTGEPVMKFSSNTFVFLDGNLKIVPNYFGTAIGFDGNSGQLEITGAVTVNAESTYPGISFTEPMPLFVSGARIIGTPAVSCDVAWANAPFYNCVFDGGVTNITADSGTANGTNVIPT